MVCPRYVETVQRGFAPSLAKGDQLEWLVNTKQRELSESVDDVERDNRTYIGFRVTYTYSEPIIMRKIE